MHYEGLTVAPSRHRGPTLELLGGFTYWDGSSEIQFPGSTGAVVAFVALQPTAVKRSVVAGTVWSDVSEARACGNLRSVLWRIKKIVPRLVRSDAGVLSIDPAVEVDYIDASAWADRVLHRHFVSDDLDRDLSTFCSNLLPGFYEDWIAFERERFRQRWLHAAEAVARELTAAGRYGEAIVCAMTAIAADPLRESAHQVAVDCHLAEHNVVEAQRQQRAYVEVLGRELGLSPSDAFMSCLPRAVGEAIGQPVGEFRQRIMR